MLTVQGHNVPSPPPPARPPNMPDEDEPAPPVETPLAPEPGNPPVDPNPEREDGAEDLAGA